MTNQLRNKVIFRVPGSMYWTNLHIVCFNRAGRELTLCESVGVKTLVDLVGHFNIDNSFSCLMFNKMKKEIKRLCGVC